MKLTAKSLDAALKRKVRDRDWTQYQTDPVAFALLLGVVLWSHQARTLLSMRDNPRTSWRSCNGAGKTMTAAIGALWRLLCWPRSLVFIIGPNARLVRQVLWRSIQRIVSHADVLRDLESPGDVPELGWRPFPDRLLLGLTSDKPEGVAGLHDENVTAIEEEGSGIDDLMHEAVLGSCTGNARLLILGNPLRRDGFFYQSFTKKADLYNCLHTSAADVIREAGNIPGLIDQRYRDEMVGDYGAGSATVRTRCDGEPPDQGDDTVIPYSLVAESRDRWSLSAATGPAFESAGPLVIGCDPSRFGDDVSAMVARRGHVALPLVIYHGLDGVQLAQRVLELAEKHRKKGEIVTVRVDVIGIGASVYDQLKQIGKSVLRVEAVNVAESATDDRYERLRDQVWFSCRHWLEAGGCLPDDEKLCGELTSPTFGFSVRGRQKVEPKDETKARLRRSPDRADALCLAVCDSIHPPAHCEATYMNPMALREMDIQKDSGSFDFNLSRAERQERGLN